MLSVFNIRKRRSPRSNCSEKDKPKREFPDEKLLGDFKLLPTELQHHILSFLTMAELSKLTMASKEICSMVEGYRHSAAGTKKFLADNSIHLSDKNEDWPTVFIQNYYQLGLYMKRSSCLKSTSKRLKQASYYLLENLICPSECGDGRRCISFYCYGTFLHTLIAGWEDVECARVLEYITANTALRRYLYKIFSSPAATHPHLEIYVRCFYRRAFIDVLRKCDDKSFWLFNILKPLPMVYQSRLLLILFLPKTAVGINFDDLVERPLCKEAFSDLGSSLTLLSESKLWNIDSIISVLDELIVVPGEWHPENKAYLLLNCASSVTFDIFMSKAINNRLGEIVTLSYHLIVVSLSFIKVNLLQISGSYSISKLYWGINQVIDNFMVVINASVKCQQTVKMVTPILWRLLDHLKPSERVYFSTELLSAFREAALDMTTLHHDHEVAIEAMTQFSQELLDIALQSVQVGGVSHSNYTKLVESQADVSGRLSNPEE